MESDSPSTGDRAASVQSGYTPRSCAEVRESQRRRSGYFWAAAPAPQLCFWYLNTVDRPLLLGQLRRNMMWVLQVSVTKNVTPPPPLFW